MDGAGNAYVTGYSETTTGYIDCVTISYTPTGEQRWLRLYDGKVDPDDPESDYGVALALAPDERSLYVVGSTIRGGSPLPPYGLYPNWLAIKYDSASGDEQWVRFYGTDHDYNAGGVDLVVDEQGAFYVAGSMATPDDTGDLAIVAYSPDGDELWAVRRSQDHEQGASITFAPDGTLVVIGARATNFYSPPYLDILIMGYSREGRFLWEATYGVGEDTIDVAGASLVDPEGSIYIAGGSHAIGEEPDWVTLKFRHQRPTPVELLDFSARQEGCGVGLEWRLDEPYAGCDVLRYDQGDVEEGTQVNEVPLSAVDGRYHITDHGTVCGRAYRYEIVGTSLQEERTVLGELEITLTPSIPSPERPLLAVQRAEPNPTSGATSIRFTLTRPSSVHFDMCDAIGRVVIQRQLDALPAGSHRISLAGSDDRGRALANGVYYYRLHIAGAPVVNGRVVFAR